jgi:hypothetical protein
MKFKYYLICLVLILGGCASHERSYLLSRTTVSVMDKAKDRFVKISSYTYYENGHYWLYTYVDGHLERKEKID